MAKTLQKFIGTSAMQSMLYHIIRLYSRTFRFTVENERTWLHEYVRCDRPVILCTYHQQFFSAIHHFESYQNHRPALMISKSRDGDIIAGVAERSGWYTFRGSSSRGGGKALQQMIEHVGQYRLAAHIVDGPRGPARVVKPGILRLAQDTQAVIIPFYVAANRAWYFNSWDRFFLPKPFAHVVLRFGDIITVQAVESRQDIERQRQSLEHKMHREYAELADQIWS